MSFNFTERGARAQAAHNCDQVFGINPAIWLLVIQGEALLELCKGNGKTLYYISSYGFIEIFRKSNFSSGTIAGELRNTTSQDVKRLNKVRLQSSCASKSVFVLFSPSIGY